MRQDPPCPIIISAFFLIFMYALIAFIIIALRYGAENEPSEISLLAIKALVPFMYYTPPSAEISNTLAIGSAGFWISFFSCLVSSCKPWPNAQRVVKEDGRYLHLVGTGFLMLALYYLIMIDNEKTYRLAITRPFTYIIICVDLPAMAGLVIGMGTMWWIFLIRATA